LVWSIVNRKSKITMPFANSPLSSFDRAVIAILCSLGLLLALIVGLGDRVGLQVVGVSPADGAKEVSTQAVVRVTFDQKISTAGAGFPLEITPPVSGTLRWDESALELVPAQPLAPNTTYTVTLASHLSSQQGRPLNGPLSWQFSTRQPRILYVAPDAQGNDQIFMLTVVGAEPIQLTQELYGIWDYTVSADGAAIIYAAMREDGGSDLWLMAVDGSQPQRLLACPEGVCSGAAWSPDGQRLVYERRVMLTPGAAPGPPRLFWLDITSGQSVPVFEDKQILGYGARWSPDSRWLSYVAPSSQGLQVYNVEDGRNVLIPSRMGGLAEWHPQGGSLLVSDIQQQKEGFAVHMLRAEPGSGQLTDMSGETAYVEDGSPAWSPDGGWIAFTRKPAGASMGKQLWLMRPDGSEAHYLTNEPDMHHSLPAWSPDGRYLLYQRYPLKEMGAQPGVWRLDVETGQTTELTTPGNRPTWLP
jgi:TolB protein